MHTRSVTVYSSTDRTATPTAQTVNIGNGLGIHLSVYVTSAATTSAITPTIEVEDETSETYYSILTGSAITSTGHTVLKVGYGIEPVANASANDLVPENVRITMTHDSTGNIQYSVSARKFYDKNF